MNKETLKILNKHLKEAEANLKELESCDLGRGHAKYVKGQIDTLKFAIELLQIDIELCAQR